MNATEKRHRRYASLGSIAQVQAERKRLRKYERANMRHLDEDWCDVKYELTPENLFARVVGGAASRWPVAGSVIAGLRAAVSLFAGCGSKRSSNCV